MGIEKKYSRWYSSFKNVQPENHSKSSAGNRLVRTKFFDIWIPESHGFDTFFTNPSTAH